MSDEFVKAREKEVKENKIVLYIKGTKEEPRCGFSAQAIQIFNQIGKPYETVNVLANSEIRTRMEEFSNWPTFPQVFIGGEFVGGADIVSEMSASGELQNRVKQVFGET